MEAIFYGLTAGLVATIVMSVIQLLFWRRWSTIGILEWHENQMIMSKLTGHKPEEVLAASFILHFANGGIAAIFYALFVKLVPILSQLNPLVAGGLFGVILWILTLAPIHKPLTGISISMHPLGRKPMVLSIILHVIYGIIVALIVSLSI